MEMRFRRRLMSHFLNSRLNTIRYLEDDYIYIPNGVSSIDLFLVGGGGGGGHHSKSPNIAGHGGNGGEVKHYYDIAVTPGMGIEISIGSGGAGGSKYGTGTSARGIAGGNTVVTINGNTYIAQGGSGGTNGSISIEPIDSQPIGNIGGKSARPDYAQGVAGMQGVKCELDEFDLNYYGASGAGGGNCNQFTPILIVGGETGGGYGGYGANNDATNTGGDATFYGAGGGGGGFNSKHTTGAGGKGYQGIVIIRYNR